MKKIAVPIIAAGAVALAAVVTPSLAATAAPTHVAAKASKSYSLSVTGDGKHASVVWTTASVKKGSTAVPKPVVHTIAKAHEPWTTHVKPSDDLYEVVAVQTTGTKLHCTIRNTHGTVIASSYSKGKNTIVTCIVAKDALLAGVGGAGGSSTGSGSTSGTGGSVSSSLLSALR